MCNSCCSGAGVEADTITPVTVAKVVTPITVEATETKAAMGYQNIDTSDITITEMLQVHYLMATQLS